MRCLMPNSIHWKLGLCLAKFLLITGKSRSTNVIAKNKALVLKMDSYLLKTLDPSILNKFKDHLIKILIRRLDEMDSSMAAFKFEFEKMYRRLCSYIALPWPTLYYPMKGILFPRTKSLHVLSRKLLDRKSYLVSAWRWDAFFITLVMIGIWRSFNQFFNYLSGLF